MGLPNGEPTWAELAGQQTGLVKPIEPTGRATDAELQAFRVKVPALLAQQTVGSVQKLLSRLAAPVHM